MTIVLGGSRAVPILHEDRLRQMASRSDLSDRRDRGHGGGRNAANVNFGGDLAVGVLLGAVARDVAGLAALVAGLAGRIQGSAVGRGAIARDVAELPAGITLHGLRLAVASKVIGSSALVAGGRARTTSEATSSAKGAGVAAAAAHGGSTAHGRTNRVGASTLEIALGREIKRERVGWGTTNRKVAGLSAVVAPSAGASAAQAQRRAVSLDVPKSLAVVALLGFGSARERATVRLMS